MQDPSQESVTDSYSPYTDLAPYYDDLFAVWGKNYIEESKKLHNLIQRFKISAGKKLLDVGCGTVEHLKHLQEHYEVSGLDVSNKMLEIARQKLPHTRFYNMDMANFTLESRFDAIVSLFSVISYAKTTSRLNQTLKSFNRHLEPGGLVIIEPWYTPQEFEAHRDDVLFGERPNFEACRMRKSTVENRIASITSHLLISTNQQVAYQVSRHEFGLFTRADLSFALEQAGLQASFIDGGLSGIGLHIGTKPI